MEVIAFRMQVITDIENCDISRRKKAGFHRCENRVMGCVLLTLYLTGRQILKNENSEFAVQANWVITVDESCILNHISAPGILFEGVCGAHLKV
jgi:hypothetical protein